MPMLDKLGIDDPVGASATHGMLLITFEEIFWRTDDQAVGLILGASGFWGVVAIGFFADDPYPLDTTNGRKGLFKGSCIMTE